MGPKEKKRSKKKTKQPFSDWVVPVLRGKGEKNLHGGKEKNKD